MPQGQDPMVARRRLKDALRRQREAAGFTQRQVADEMDWSPSKLIRIEAGQVAVSTTDLRALLQHYGVVDPVRVAALEALSRTARERAWWSNYRNVANADLRAFLGFETSASIIRNFEPLNVPGLLQTREYAREILAAVDQQSIDELVDLRMERQELLTRDEAPEVHFIMSQAVIERVAGGPRVMRRQLRHIARVAAYPNVTVRIVPWTVGFFPRYRVAYTVFEFPDAEDPAILCREGPTGDIITREGPLEDTPNDYLASFWEIEREAPATDTPALLQAAIDTMTRLIGEAAPGSLTPVDAPDDEDEEDPDGQEEPLAGSSS
ncbi:helix-turn-helix domain-containing protein [Yinghuangia soli]|uniref:Helix-turn-helix domain-containing protein n=1 Tax=Yinghuangia soli TaxID=2908204 RepID=A0AA41U2A9_9ACTN|nr:helix-turn-helix transcriptional regulator [Yinghuangia soli]MCF2531598.1 helix-turn-helix domain-containing protein [Yinghuangia soli]